MEGRCFCWREGSVDHHNALLDQLLRMLCGEEAGVPRIALRVLEPAGPRFVRLRSLQRRLNKLFLCCGAAVGLASLCLEKQPHGIQMALLGGKIARFLHAMTGNPCRVCGGSMWISPRFK
uniref:Uncharacterized protein n=2 Tax=Pyramimonas obovata TaxID=1411642 RepID=A0A7S0N3A1_9CHLO